MAEQGDTKPVWIAWANTDNTEGRGRQYPMAVCESEVTARRLGKGKYVMGSDCPVEAAEAIYHKGFWCAPSVITSPSGHDATVQAENKKRDEVIARALAAGVTEDEITFLIGCRR